jgi:hypothetical protein
MWNIDDEARRTLPMEDTSDHSAEGKQAMTRKRTPIIYCDKFDRHANATKNFSFCETKGDKTVVSPDPPADHRWVGRNLRFGPMTKE